MEQRRLGKTDVYVTEVGLGTAPLGGLFTSVTEEAATETINAALDGGIRFFDTAPWYGFGQAEQRLGRRLQSATEPLVISSKVGRLLDPCEHAPEDWPEWPDKLDLAPRHDYGYEGVHRSFEDSLARLGLPRIDVLFVHDIGRMAHGEDHGRHFADAMGGGLRALQELRDDGKIGALGIGVNEVEVLHEALDVAAWDVFLLAGRYTLLEQEPALSSLLPACVRAGTSVVIGGAFNSGLLAGGGTYNYEAAPQKIIRRRDSLLQVCGRHGIPLEAAALQLPLAHPAVASLLVGCRTPHEVRENLDHVSRALPKEFWSELVSMGLLPEAIPLPAEN
jgi:D-threo-aldose 1-dehydrogenase